MDAQVPKDNHSEQAGPTILAISESEEQQLVADHCQGESKSLLGLPIYLVDKGKGIIQALDVPGRNALAHKSPALVKHAVAEALQALQREANKVGLYKGTNCVVHWKPSAIPFHIEFEISASDSICQHLASIRHITAKDPDQYARSLVPLAKLFLSKPTESRLPHLPFTRPHLPSDNRSSHDAEDRKTTETVQYAHLITSQYKSLKDIDIKTAEATAKMVNAGKILSGLLVYLASPKPRFEGAVTSTESSKAEDKGLQAKKRPIAATLKQLKPKSSTHEVQCFRPTLNERVVVKPQNGTDGLTVSAIPNSEENSSPDDTSAVKKSLPDKPSTAINSSKKEDEFKKKNQGRNQLLNEGIKNRITSTVSAYPTQRPPRQKRVKKTVTARESLQAKGKRPETCDLEQASETQPQTQEASNDDDHKEDTPEPDLVPDLLQKDRSRTEPLSETLDESEAGTAAAIPDPESIGAEDGDFPCDLVPGEDLITAKDKPTTLSLRTKRRPQHEGGVHGLLWGYKCNRKIDKVLNGAGIWLWAKPNTYFFAQPLLRTERFGHFHPLPVVVSHKRTGSDEPIIECDGNAVHIVPHGQPWQDIRAQESHPDFLVPWRLAEYQACEAAGYQVWRHDRDLLKCRKLGCNVMISDYHESALICLGCGPKSFVRYCSLQHQFNDIREHWKECGTRKMLLKRVIDHATAPSKFARMYPAIKQKHGPRTAALNRQQLCASLTNGHYTLFDLDSTYSKTLCWPKQDPKWPEMDRRIERLLNLAFFNSRNHCILGYLYRLLREILRCQGEWSERVERLLKFQFESEFSNYKVNTKWHHGDAPCQCEWSGKMLPRWNHLSTCWAFDPAADDRDLVGRRNCIEATVEHYEERFWILRAWRQQHPTQNNWRLRAAGYGFPALTPDEGCYKLGPGWTGWGGKRGNICWDQGVKHSMQSG